MLVALKSKDNGTPVRYTIRSEKVGASFPLSGGLTPDSAELVDLSAPIEGVIDIGESRHYRYEAKSAQTTGFLVYAEQMKPESYSSTLVFSALAADGVKLGEGTVTTHANISTPEFKKKEISFVSVGPDSVLFTIKNRSDSSPVHYRIIPEVHVAK